MGIEEEVWVKCILSDSYQVSNKGRIRSVNRVGVDGKNRKGVVLRQHLKRGRRAVTLSVDGMSVGVLIHRVVYESFVGEIKNNYYVIHIDGNKENNNLENLTLISCSDSHLSDYKERRRTPPRGVKGPHSKLNLEDVKEIKRLRDSEITLREIATRFNVSISCVSRIVNNKTYT